MSFISQSFESVAVRGGRFVNVGHYVTNFGHRCVVEGWAAGGLVVRLLDSDGNMVPEARGRFVANPELCA
jgi:hypothetical protein